MNVLALDLATNTGVCVGTGDRLPLLSHNRLPSTGPDVGAFLCAYRDWLIALLEEHGPTLIVFEAPILPKTTAIATVRKLVGLAGITEMVASDDGIEVREVTTSAVKKALTGHGNAKKPAMVAACRGYGLSPHTYIKDGEEASDEADAFGVWLAALRARFPVVGARWDALSAASWRAAA